MAQIEESISKDCYPKRDALKKEITTLLEQAGVAKEVERLEITKNGY